MLSLSLESRAQLFACLGFSDAQKWLRKIDVHSQALSQKWMLRLGQVVEIDEYRLTLRCQDLSNSKFLMVIPFNSSNGLNEFRRLIELNEVNTVKPVSFDDATGIYLIPEVEAKSETRMDARQVFVALRNTYSVEPKNNYPHICLYFDAIFDQGWRDSIRGHNSSSLSNLSIAKNIFDDLFRDARGDDVLLHGNLYPKNISTNLGDQIIFANPNYSLGSAVFDIVFYLVTTQTNVLEDELRKLESSFEPDQVNRLWQMAWILSVLHDSIPGLKTESEANMFSRLSFIEKYSSRS